MVGQGTETRWVPRTEDEKNAVKNQLDRLLLDPSFAKSERYPSFLRFIVEHALDGESDSLKERTLGIEVFGRIPSYDTAEDPIVRVTAAKIRKRITKYYESPEHQGELRLSFPAGSYVPIFELPKDLADHVDAEAVAPWFAGSHPEAVTEVRPGETAGIAEPLRATPNKAQAFLSRRWMTLGAASVLGVAVLVGSLVWGHARHDAFMDFWRPVVSSSHAVLFCIADEPRGTITLMDPSDPALPDLPGHPPSIIDVDNISTVTDMSRMIASHGHTLNVQGQRRTTLTDLSSGPDVLLGAYNNIWTLRFTKNLRFHFGRDPESGALWIADRKAPEDRTWIRDKQMQTTETGRDFALAARFVSTETGQPVVLVAGLSHNSNVAAVKFVLSPEEIRELDLHAPADWRRRNLEFVLETMVVDGHAGQPRVVAAETW